MNNPISNSISAHLEFLGFKVEDNTEKDNLDVLLCKHDSKSNIRILIFNEDTIIFQSTYSWLEWKHSDLFEKINTIHSKVNWTRWYLTDLDEKTPSVVIETIFKGYSKQSFGEIIETFEKEIQWGLQEIV